VLKEFIANGNFCPWVLIFGRHRRIGELRLRKVGFDKRKR